MKIHRNKANQSIKALIFDKDGTLADARAFLRELAIARAQACAGALLPGTPDQAKAYFDSLCLAFGVTPTGLDPDGLMAVGTRIANEQAAIDLLAEMGRGREAGKNWIPQLFTAVDSAIVSKAAQTPPFPGTGEMLLKLSLRRVKVGILSSDRTSGVGEFLRYYGFEELVKDWQGTEPEDEPKPNPELFWQLCDRLQVVPAQALMVGDSWADLEVGRNAGAAGFVSVGEGWGRFPLAGADYVLQDWNDLLSLVNGTDGLHFPRRSLQAYPLET